MSISESVCLGIDIGGTTVKHAIINKDGNILERGSFDTGSSITEEIFLEKFLCVIHDSISRGIAGIGVCSLGAVNSTTGQILGAVQNLPFLEGLNLRNLVQEIYPGIPVSICNDVHAVAKGEKWLGVAQNCDNFFCLSLGTGLGGALVINSQLVKGAHHHAGEIGYLDYQDNDHYLEKKVSTRSIVDKAAQLLGYEEITGITFFEFVRKGNIVCIDILNEWVDALSRVIANLIITLDLDLIIIGGGVSNEKELLIPRIAKATDGMLPQEFRGHTRIAAAKFTNDSGTLGAVSDLLCKVSSCDCR